ncbi:Alpha-ketoglutarate-dependent sulfonate dioxygenase [Yarrowia sp. C11]|nr:Alpha-ketoglutarate-dependent sulfonate dioxygenase [Yarrowia sp. E02]KAG5369952.1 Alpha-ketoglutarate-dependent sulfonate dioxygenase [Yarrowia sp. C11]
MAPTIETSAQATSLPSSKASYGANLKKQPIKYTGSLDKYDHFEVTPNIGEEFSSVQLSSLLESDDYETLVRDLAVLVAQRGVVFFRNQDINDEQQKKLGELLGHLTGKPKESGLHVHPTEAPSSETGQEVLILQPDQGVLNQKFLQTTTRAAKNWHTDITFEKVPSDYAILKIIKKPSSGGGDTLWASGYAAYEKLSPTYQKILESLTAHHSGQHFHAVAKQSGHGIVTTPRGHPLNSGDDLYADHPIIRTNPVTGWKSLYVNPIFTESINGLGWDESRSILDFLNQNLKENHDIHVRFRWNDNDVAIWDNRSTYHTATYDYSSTDRLGHRVLSCGEVPYLDENSISRSDAIKADLEAADATASKLAQLNLN